MKKTPVKYRCFLSTVKLSGRHYESVRVPPLVNDTKD